jgi:hypothetical protein
VPLAGGPLDDLAATGEGRRSPLPKEQRATDLTREATEDLAALLASPALAWSWPPGCWASSATTLTLQTAKGRKAYAGTAPVTRASGTKTVVAARMARNDRLANACTQWAFAALSASPGARRCYDRHRAAGNRHAQTQRALANRLVGILHGCLASHTAYSEQVAWPDRQPAAA